MKRTCFIKGEISDESIRPALSVISGCRAGDTLEIMIDSPGGVIKSAFDAVRAINDVRDKGTRIVCKSFRQCCSAAVMILLAGDERIIDEDTFVLVHQPLVEGMLNATEMAEQIKALENYEHSMAEYYAKRTRLDVAGVITLMRANAPVSPADLLSAGFVTKVLPLNHDNKGGVLNLSDSITNTNKMNPFKKILAMALPGGVVKKNISYFTADGKELVFENVEEGQELHVDDSRATIDGTPAEGEYVLADGVKLHFEGGLLKEIIRPEEEVEDKLDALAQGVYAALVDVKNLCGKVNDLVEKVNTMDGRVTTISNNITTNGIATTTVNSDDLYNALRGKGGKNGK